MDSNPGAAQAKNVALSVVLCTALEIYSARALPEHFEVQMSAERPVPKYLGSLGHESLQDVQATAREDILMLQERQKVDCCSLHVFRRGLGHPACVSRKYAARESSSC